MRPLSGDRPSAVVIGAGVFGASVAHALVHRSWSVQIVEQYSPGHVRSSSHDVSRLLRMSHGGEDLADSWYTRSALRSRDSWLQIGEEEGSDLFVPSGAVWFARSDNGFESRSERHLRALGIPVERLSPDGVRELFPDLRTDDLTFALYEPLAGVLRATTCVKTLVRRAVRSGAVLRTGRAQPTPAGVCVDGEELAADRVIWAGGPWLSSVFPGVVNVRSVKQSVFHFGVGPMWRTPPVPAWVDDSGFGYGFGDLDGMGMKAIYTVPDTGVLLDPDVDEREPDADYLAATRHLLAHRFPSLASSPLVTARVCQYELSPDQHFIIAPIDDTGRAWVVGGGSGHGFKHGPAVGEHVADLLESRTQPRAEFSLKPPTTVGA